MTAALLAKAALSSAFVGALLALLRRAGPRAGGLAAALPITSVPALFWLWLEHGGAPAASAALGSLWGTGLTALLGLGFARLALALPAGVAAVLAWLGVVVLAALSWALPGAPLATALLTGGVILFSQAQLPRPPRAARPPAPARSAAWLTMAIAGAMSLAVSVLSLQAGPQLGGLVAAIPVVAMCALSIAYRQGRLPLALSVLRGYLDGMLAKAAFLCALGVAWAADAGALAWPLALAGAAATLVAQGATRQWQLRRTGTR